MVTAVIPIPVTQVTRAEPQAVSAVGSAAAFAALFFETMAEGGLPQGAAPDSAEKDRLLKKESQKDESAAPRQDVRSDPQPALFTLPPAQPKPVEAAEAPEKTPASATDAATRPSGAPETTTRPPQDGSDGTVPSNPGDIAPFDEANKTPVPALPASGMDGLPDAVAERAVLPGSPVPTTVLPQAAPVSQPVTLGAADQALSLPTVAEAQAAELTQIERKAPGAAALHKTADDISADQAALTRQTAAGSLPDLQPKGMPTYWAAREAAERSASHTSDDPVENVTTAAVTTPAPAPPPAPMPGANIAVVLPASVTAYAAAEIDNLLIDPDVTASAPFGSATGQASGQSGTSGAPAAPLTMPRALPGQIAAALAARTERPVELRMITEELGGLHLSLQQDGDQIRVVLAADRGDTLDLLRRNGDLLIQELRAAGFSGATLSFTEGGDREGRQMPDPHPVMPAAATPDLPPSSTTLPPPRARAASGGGLDLRY